MLNTIIKYQQGGVLDTQAMFTDMIDDRRYYKNGHLTNAGQKRTQAIEEIETAQAAGYRYVVNDDNASFRIVNSEGHRVDADVDPLGRGVGVGERFVKPLYGAVNQDKRRQKEVSMLMSHADEYMIQPSAELVPKNNIAPTKDTPTAGNMETTRDQVTQQAETSKKKAETSEVEYKSALDFVHQFTGGMKPNPQHAQPYRPGLVTSGGGGTGGDGDDANTDQNNGLSVNVGKGLPDSWSDYGTEVDDNLRKLNSTVYNPSVGQAGGFKSWLGAQGTLDEQQAQLQEYIRLKKQGKLVDSEVPISDGKKGSVKARDASLEQLQTALAAAKEKRKNTWIDQADESTDAALGYLQFERKRLADIDWDNVLERQKVLSYLDAKIDEVVMKNNEVVKNPGAESFIAYYGGEDNLPSVTINGAYWDAHTNKIASLEEKQVSEIKFKEDQEAVRLDNLSSRKEKMMSYMESLEPLSAKGGKFFPVGKDFLSYNDVINEIKNASTLSKLDNLKLPDSKPGSVKSFRLIKWDSIRVRETDHGWIFSTPLKVTEYKKGGKMELEKSDSLVPRKEARVQKAQNGMIDWAALNSAIKSMDPAYNNSFYPSVSGYNPAYEARIKAEETAKKKAAEEAKKQAEKDIAAISLDNRFGQTGDWSSNRGKTQEEINLEKRIAEAEAASAAATEARAAGNTVDNDSGDDMIITDDRNKKGQRENGMYGKTGINRVLGPIDFGDISNLFFAIRAKNRKIADVPVFQEKYTKTGARNVLAKRDLDASELNAANAAIANRRSQYDGSDPIMDMISKNITAEAKADDTIQLAARRGAYRRSEDDRIDMQMEDRRQQLVADFKGAEAAGNRNLERRVNAEAMKAAELQRKESQFDQNMNSVVQNIQTKMNADTAARQQYETGLRIQEHQGKVALAQSEYSSLVNMDKQIEFAMMQAQTSGNQEQYDYYAQQQALVKQSMAEKKAELDNINTLDMDTARKEANDIRRSSSLFAFKNGEKLLPRK